MTILPDHPFTTRSAREQLGFDRHTLQAALRDRRIVRLLRGVYVRAGLADTVELRVQAARLVVNPTHVVVDRTAAWLHGIDVLEFHEKEVLPPTETIALRGRNPSHAEGVLAGSRDLAPGDIVQLHGVRVTTPIRTTLDLGCQLPKRHAVALISAFMRQHGISREELEAQLPRYRGRRGVVQLRALLPLGHAGLESMAEAWVWFEMAGNSLPRPEVQWSISVDGRERYRLDFAYPRHRVAVEYDGVEFHTSPEQRAYDRRRRDWLREKGWIVVVITQEMLSQQRVDTWIAEIRSALRERSFYLRRIRRD